MGHSLKEQRRAEFKRYKEDVKNEGKPFFPYAIFHDTVMSLVVVAVIIGLAVVWYTTARRHRAGILGPWYTRQGRPGDNRLHPAAGLVLLLPLLPAPHLQVAGDGGPRHRRDPDAAAILPIGLPFYDRRPERRPCRRPVAIVTAILVVLSMGVLTWKGATAKEALGSEPVGGLPEWAVEQGFVGNTAAEAGATLFAQAGCMNCHTYLGSGSSNQGAPDLSEVGRRSAASSQGLPREPGRVRQQGDELVLLPRRREPDEPRHLPEASKGPQDRGAGRR